MFINTASSYAEVKGIPVGGKDFGMVRVAYYYGDEQIETMAYMGGDNWRYVREKGLNVGEVIVVNGNPIERLWVDKEGRVFNHFIISVTYISKIK